MEERMDIAPASADIRLADQVFELHGQFGEDFYHFVKTFRSVMPGEKWLEAKADDLPIGVIGQMTRKPIARITVPKSRPYPRLFYEKVAKTYTNLAAYGSRRPAVENAEASDVPTSTVHRWVKEARRIGLMPEGQRGKLT
jgi:hypothetical protein